MYEVVHLIPAQESIVDDKRRKSRSFVSEVKKLAEEYNLPVFVVTDGASGYSNTGCEAVKHARKCHEKWELSNGEDPDEDWSKEGNMKEGEK